VDSFRFIVCVRAECRQVFFLCRRCDRGDRYCSRRCAEDARRASLRAAGRRYQHGRRGRLHHAARQGRYRRQREKVMHQTSQPPSAAGMLPAPSPAPAPPSPRDGKEAAFHVQRVCPTVPGRLRCARCGRRGRFVRHTTLVPYYEGKNPDTDLLWFVHELSNTDKHRTINIIVGQVVVKDFRLYMDFGEGGIRFSAPGWLEAGVLHDGAKVATYPLVGLQGGSEVKLEAQTLGFITLGNEFPWGAQPVEHHVGRAWLYIRDEVLPRFERFF